MLRNKINRILVPINEPEDEALSDFLFYYYNFLKPSKQEENEIFKCLVKIKVKSGAIFIFPQTL